MSFQATSLPVRASSAPRARLMRARISLVSQGLGFFERRSLIGLDNSENPSKSSRRRESVVLTYTSLRMPNPKSQRPRKLHTRSVVSVAFAVDEGQRVSRAASAEGQPVSTFIRQAAIAWADEILKAAKTVAA